jgi:hypothetical protein
MARTVGDGVHEQTDHAGIIALRAWFLQSHVLRRRLPAGIGRKTEENIRLIYGYIGSWCELQEEGPQGYQGDPCFRYEGYGT